MKKVIISLILIIALVSINSLAIDAEAQARLELAILLPLTGPNAAWGIELQKSVEQITGRISKDLQVLYYDEGIFEPISMSKLVDSLMSKGIKVMIGPVWGERGARSVVPIIQNRDIITIFPVYSVSLIEFVEQQSKNAYVIAEPTEEIILAVDQSVRKAGPTDINSLKNALLNEAKKAQEKAAAYQARIAREVIKAVGQWEKEKNIPVEPSAKEFLEVDYSSKFTSYMIRFSAREKEFPQLIKTVPRDTKDILDLYSKLRYEKGTKISQVNLQPFMESGVNGCEELPCKQHCCDHYKVQNVDDCFRTMKCK